MGKPIELDRVIQFIKEIDYTSWLALKHHKTHKNQFLDFNKHFYLRDIYRDNSPNMSIRKSTQCGVTEYLIVRAIARAIQGSNIFYVLPTYSLVNRFVRNRIDKSINHTDYYRVLEREKRQEETTKRSESMTLKDIGSGVIAFVGSNSTAAFTEFPADEIIIDEIDECDPDKILMAWERMSHSEKQYEIRVGNPTFPGMGSDKCYSESDQRKWHVKCSAGHWVNLDWFEHVVREIEENRYMIRDEYWSWGDSRDIYPICHCGKPIDRYSDGEWVTTEVGPVHGYHISKLFAGTVSIIKILERFTDGLTNDEILQRFYNADLGLPFIAYGSRIDRQMILDCVADYQYGKEDGVIIVGVDVGKLYHIVIKRMLPDGRMKTLFITETPATEEVIRILSEYRISAGVIDAEPETREARKIAAKFKFLFLCYWGEIKADSINPATKILTVQKTPALDAVREALLTKAIEYPYNVNNAKEFLEQMTASTRVFNPDKKSRGHIGAYEWVHSKPDHYFCATAYCLMARKLVLWMKGR